MESIWNKRHSLDYIFLCRQASKLMEKSKRFSYWLITLSKTYYFPFNQFWKQYEMYVCHENYYGSPSVWKSKVCSCHLLCSSSNFLLYPNQPDACSVFLDFTEMHLPKAIVSRLLLLWCKFCKWNIDRQCVVLFSFKTFLILHVKDFSTYFNGNKTQTLSYFWKWTTKA